MTALMCLAFFIIGVFACSVPGFFWILPFVPLGIFLIWPVVKAMREPSYRERFVDAVNIRAIMLAAAMLAVYGILRFSGHL